MKKIKSVLKIIPLLILLSLSQWSSSDAERRTFVLAGDENYPPFSFMEKVTTYSDAIVVKTERASGFSVDLAHLLGETVNRDIRFRLLPPEELIEGFRSGRLSGFITTFPPEKTDAPFVLAGPIFEMEYLIFVFKDNEFVRSMGSLKGTIVAVYENSAAADELSEYENIDVRLASSLLEALHKLNERHVTAVIAEREAASFLIKRHGLVNIKAASQEASFTRPYAIALNPEEPVLARALNLGLIALDNDHSIARLSRKWFESPPPEDFPWKMVIFVTAGITLVILLLSGVLWVLSLNATVKIRTRQIEIMSKKMVEKDKLAVLGKLAGQIAHELRTPLSIIHNSVFLLRKEGSSDKSLYEKRLRLLEDKIKLTSNILESILSYSRVKAEVPTTISVRKCVETVIKDMELSSDIDFHLNITEDEDKLNIYIDFHQLYSVLRNIITNAVQAMDEKGELSVTCYTSNNGRWVNIKICDTAGGVPPPLQDKIFDLFYSSKVTGTGLGLPISKAIIEAHSGSLYLARSDETGSCFMIELPRSEIK